MLRNDSCGQPGLARHSRAGAYINKRPSHLYYLYCCIWRHVNEAVNAVNCWINHGCHRRLVLAVLMFAGFCATKAVFA